MSERPIKQITIYDCLLNNGRDKSVVFDLAKTLTGKTVLPIENLGLLSAVRILLFKNFPFQVIQKSPFNYHFIRFITIIPIA